MPLSFTVALPGDQNRDNDTMTTAASSVRQARPAPWVRTGQERRASTLSPEAHTGLSAAQPQGAGGIAQKVFEFKVSMTPPVGTKPIPWKWDFCEEKG